MNVIYSKALNGYIVSRIVNILLSTGQAITQRQLIATDIDRMVAIKKALSRINTI